MYAMMVRQALLAMGMRDQSVLDMAERIMAGGFDNPRLETFAGDSFPVPEGADTMLVSADKLDGKYTILLVREKRGCIAQE